MSLAVRGISCDAGSTLRRPAWGRGRACLISVTTAEDQDPARGDPWVGGGRKLNRCGILLQHASGSTLSFELMSGWLRQVDLSHSLVSMAQLGGGRPDARGRGVACNQLRAGARWMRCADGGRRSVRTVGDFRQDDNTRSRPLGPQARDPFRGSNQGALRAIRETGPPLGGLARTAAAG